MDGSVDSGDALRSQTAGEPLLAASHAADPDRMNALLEASLSVLCIVDRIGIIRAITPNAARVLGEACQTAAEVEVNVAELLQADDPYDVMMSLEGLASVEPGETQTWTFRTRSAMGQPRWLEVAGTHRLVDPRIAGFALEIRDVTRSWLPDHQSALGAAALEPIGRDITYRKRTEASVQSTAFYDPISGISTFNLLCERARQMLALARRHGHTAALLHIDMNGLHSVNASLGRDVGDQLLRKFAERLKQGLRESDTIARLGSDEFLILLSDVAEADATARVVRRLKESVSRPFQIGAHSVNLGASFGVSMYPQDATTFEEMVEYATLAMKRAQASGSGYEFYSRELTELTLERLSLEEDLRWAWERKQFVLHYQAVIAVKTNRIIGTEALTRAHVIGAEALARWPHMERGEIAPSQFIPVAERTGRIVALDRWAIAAATRQAAMWSQEGWQGWVAVNLSARSLHDADLPSYIARCIETHGMEAGRLVLEITESAAMRDIDITARILAQLKQAGALIALDDFGVGHSSLAYLKHFPVDVLKLDHNFVSGIGCESKQEHLIETMITFAHRIGAYVVAEGVEQQTQLEWLRDADCDYVQGYLLGRPVPPDMVFTKPL